MIHRLLFLNLALLCLAFLMGLSPSTSFSQPRSSSELILNARNQIGRTVSYDGSYRSLAYPGGDVDISTGVCTDVIIRAYRGLGIDLQQLVHEDMKQHFAAYPSRKLWGLTSTDRNIDHRRVPNLQKFFSRKGITLKRGEPILPGDILTWMLPGNLPHIGIVSDRKNMGSGNYLVIHNIGQGVQEEDVVNNFPLTGHYRYMPQ